MTLFFSVSLKKFFFSRMFKVHVTKAPLFFFFCDLTNDRLFLLLVRLFGRKLTDRILLEHSYPQLYKISFTRHSQGQHGGSGSRMEGMNGSRLMSCQF